MIIRYKKSKIMKWNNNIRQVLSAFMNEVILNRQKYYV